jgi:hypothetical protein
VGEQPGLRTFPLADDRLQVIGGALWTHMSPAAKVFLQIAKEGSASSRPIKKNV